MPTEFLSDFRKVFNPSYQPDTFQPYLSTILTIMVTTILTFGFQTTTNAIYTYSARPASFQNSILQLRACTDFTHTALLYLCTGGQNTNAAYQATSLFSSLEQDLHKPTN